MRPLGEDAEGDGGQDGPRGDARRPPRTSAVVFALSESRHWLDDQFVTMDQELSPSISEGWSMPNRPGSANAQPVRGKNNSLGERQHGPRRERQGGNQLVREKILISIERPRAHRGRDPHSPKRHVTVKPPAPLANAGLLLTRHRLAGRLSRASADRSHHVLDGSAPVTWF
jgi:hypothetical protein